MTSNLLAKLVSLPFRPIAATVRFEPLGVTTKSVPVTSVTFTSSDVVTSNFTEVAFVSIVSDEGLAIAVTCGAVLSLVILKEADGVMLSALSVNLILKSVDASSGIFAASNVIVS